MLNKEQHEHFISILPKEISDSLKEIFREKANYVVLRKGDTLIGEIFNKANVYFLLKGSCIRFIITPTGNEKAIMFHTENFIPVISNIHVSSDVSLVKYEIRANEATELISIATNIGYEWFAKDSAFSLFVNQQDLNSISVINQLQNHLIGLTSEEFFKWLFQKYPFLFQRFSSKDIANFMGVTPTWLSLLKRKLAKK